MLHTLDAMKVTLDQAAIEEICANLEGLKGKRAKEVAASLASRYGVCVQQIYAVSQDVRPRRKPRSDRGKRQADLSDPGLQFVAAQVARFKMATDEAILNARIKGHSIPYSTGALRRRLREEGISRQQIETRRQPHRRFEADQPCWLFQFDITGLKQRWMDTKTRKLFKVSELEISKNHPNESPRRVPVWAFTMVDDYSRRIFSRFYAVEKPTQTQVIDFILEAFREMGVPRVLYTDNDRVITGSRMRRAERLLNQLFAESGGFELAQHRPGAPQATGKVENSHQYIEECERSIALLQDANLETLNRYAQVICSRKNRRPHRETGVAPLIRWRENNDAIRIPPDQSLNAIFQATEHECEIRPDITIRIDGQAWQLPRQSPFIDWAEQGVKVAILWPPQVDYFWLINGEDCLQINRVLARPDVVGAFKAIPETKSQRVRKELDQVQLPKISIEEIEAFDANESAQSPKVFPKPRIEATPEMLAAVGLLPNFNPEPAPVLEMPVAQEPQFVTVKLINVFQAMDRGQAAGTFSNPITPEQKAWVQALFDSRALIEQPEFDSALEQYGKPQLRLARL